jgi:hypothetical protein
MQNFRELIDCWPSLREFATDLDVSPNTAAGWYRRYSVPAKYWDTVLSCAADRDIDVSPEDLIRLASKAA